jgi:UTP--glucose-1-phosphate uridylyltransferase
VFAPIRKAVVPVAGLGTRMLRATKAIPKELLPVYNGQIEPVVNEAIAVGNNETIRVSRIGKEAIEIYYE